MIVWVPSIMMTIQEPRTSTWSNLFWARWCLVGVRSLDSHLTAHHLNMGVYLRLMSSWDGPTYVKALKYRSVSECRNRQTHNLRTLKGFSIEGEVASKLSNLFIEIRCNLPQVQREEYYQSVCSFVRLSFGHPYWAGRRSLFWNLRLQVFQAHIMADLVAHV